MESKLPENIQKENAKQRDQKIADLKGEAEKGLRLAWNKKIKIEISDPLCGKRVLPITYKLKWVDFNEHFLMNICKLLPEEDQENVDYNAPNCVLNTNSWTFAHEIGHCIGLPDEYSNESKSTVIIYFKPEGTLDEPIRGRTRTEDTPEAKKTIMSTHFSATVHPRHACHMAIETHKLLSEELGRTITCNITSA